MQKDKFLSAEGNKYFSRNFLETEQEKIDFIKKDPLIPLILDIPDDDNQLNILEIGFGQGLRLKELGIRKNWILNGVDPSLEAVNHGLKIGINAKQGTADKLPFKDNSMDLLIFGFCLYVCDNEDLFKIAAEANRVLKNRSWIAIYDFWSFSPIKNIYSHDPTMNSFKNNRNLMFDWHPYFEVVSQKIVKHKFNYFTDNNNEKISVSIIRKYA